MWYSIVFHTAWVGGCTKEGRGLGNPLALNQQGEGPLPLPLCFPFQAAVRGLVHGSMRAGDGGVVAVDAHGGIVLAFNSAGMFRGAADSTGRFEVGVFGEMLS